MTILILTKGTRGDVQPYVALGKGLVKAGHQVTVCTARTFEPFIRRHGLGYAHMNDDLIEFMRTDLGKAAFENTSNAWEAIRTAIKIGPAVKPMQRAHVREAWEAVDSVKPELVLFHPKAIGAPDFAAQVGARLMLAFYLPIFVETSEMPAMGLPDLGLGGWYNRLTYKLISVAMSKGASKMVNQWRAEQGLAPRGGDLLRTPDGEPTPAMHAYSPSVIPRPADWPEWATVTGYWFLDDSEGWEPPDELRRFLEVGDPPVYVGFGSIFGRDPKRLTQTVLDAVRRTGVRAILAGGWGGIDTAGLELPGNVLAIEGAPHDWLFPQVSAVIHHGGCGTTAAGLRAGRPSILCPFFGDQPFWGRRVDALGAGPKPIPQKRLNSENLAGAIAQATRDESIQSAAARLGERIRAEDGIGNAIAFIERHLG